MAAAGLVPAGTGTIVPYHVTAAYLIISVRSPRAWQLSLAVRSPAEVVQTLDAASERAPPALSRELSQLREQLAARTSSLNAAKVRPMRSFLRVAA